MGADFKGPAVPHRTLRKLAIEKGTDPRGFTESPPMEHGAGGSVAKERAGGKYTETPPNVQSAPIKTTKPSPFKNMKGG